MEVEGWGVGGEGTQGPLVSNRGAHGLTTSTSSLFVFNESSAAALTMTTRLGKKEALCTAITLRTPSGLCARASIAVDSSSPSHPTRHVVIRHGNLAEKLVRRPYMVTVAQPVYEQRSGTTSCCDSTSHEAGR